MLERPLRGAAEVATLLTAVHTLETHAAQIAFVRSQHSEVSAFAQTALGEIASGQMSLSQNCSSVHSESSPLERIERLGQDFLSGLMAADPEQFDQLYVSALSGLHERVDALFASYVVPPLNSPEDIELARLRVMLARQGERLASLKSALGAEPTLPL
jgi:predicted outer membrane protein